MVETNVLTNKQEQEDLMEVNDGEMDEDMKVA